MNTERVNLFTPRTSPALTEKLDAICQNFLETCEGTFDELLLVHVNETVLPKYNFSYRSDGSKPNKTELEGLVLLSSTVKISDFEFIESAQGTDFDILMRLSKELYIAINNTAATLDDLVPQGVDKRAYLMKYVGKLFNELVPVQSQLVSELEE